jgi:hypothetical protein
MVAPFRGDFAFMSKKDIFTQDLADFHCFFRMPVFREKSLGIQDEYLYLKYFSRKMLTFRV